MNSLKHKIIINKINQLRKQKNAIILAHYYQEPEIQDIADFIGDSLALAQKAVQVNADIIILAGVYFMAETAKIINPSKKVLIPDINAGCSLAASCPPDKFKMFKSAHPDHIVVSYVNTSAEIKALTDIVCTSSNAVQIIQSLPKDQKIIFAPDKNLGNYINNLTNRNMILWDGACHVHEEFSLEKLIDLKKQYPEAKIIAHPECKKPILLVSDFIGSTSHLLNFVQKSNADIFIVVTESGIIHQMKKSNPSKTFIPAPPIDSTCGCNDCNYMKLITLNKIYSCLEDESPEIIMDNELIASASKSIFRMLDISKQLGI